MHENHTVLDGKEYCVRLDNFEKCVVETIKQIEGAYYFAHGGWWIIDAKFYDQLINQIKVKFPQIKVKDQLDKIEAQNYYSQKYFAIKGIL